MPYGNPKGYYKSNKLTKQSAKADKKKKKK